MITFRNVTLRRSQYVLIEHLDWTIFQKQRIGIIGANGCGKTSLFALLLNNLQVEEGELDIPRHIKFAHVSQETPALSVSALQFVLEGDQELCALNQALSLAEDKHDGHRIAELHVKLATIDGYTAPARAAQLLSGLGFHQDEQSKPVSAFSGGWRVRLNLAKALMCRSDILLLDEPTNHLDLDAVLWLEQWLNKYSGTLLLISHDRDFLDKTINHVAHISHQQLKIYTGNYSSFESQRATALLLQQATYEKQQKQLAHLQSFVDRFRAKATKAKQAQSRLKAIERLDLICAVQTESPFQFHFINPKHCPNPLLTLQDASISYGTDPLILNHLNLSITPKDRIAILGPNGAGKSSLIKLLAGELLAHSGECTVSAGLKIGYFAQHQIDHLQLDESPLAHLKNLAPESKEQALRTYLGSFGFSGDDVFQPIKNFSGGEKSRLALALLIWQQPNLLLLDEPTNHLDLEMRHALTLALQEYEGAMLIVSHDRFLVRTVTDKLMLVADGKLENFEGDLNDYQQWLLDFRKEQAVSRKNKSNFDSSKKLKRQQDAKQREIKKPLLHKIKKLEEEMEKIQKLLSNIEIDLASGGIYDPENKDKLRNLLLNQSELKKKLVEIENAWLQACDERDG